MRIALGLAAALLALVPGALAPTCTGLAAAEACVTVGSVPAVNVSTDLGGEAQASVFVESGAIIVPIVAQFYGPTAAVAYKHFLIPTVSGEIAFFEFGLVGTFGGVCFHAPGAADCVPFLV